MMKLFVLFIGLLGYGALSFASTEQAPVSPVKAAKPAKKEKAPPKGEVQWWASSWKNGCAPSYGGLTFNGYTDWLRNQGSDFQITKAGEAYVVTDTNINGPNVIVWAQTFEECDRQFKIVKERLEKAARDSK